MWGIAWGIKIKTAVFETDEYSSVSDIIKYKIGSGERIRTSDLRVMRTKTHHISLFPLFAHQCY